MEDLQCEAPLITEIVNNLCLPSTSAYKHVCIFCTVFSEATRIFFSDRLKIVHVKGSLCVCMYVWLYTSTLNKQGFSFSILVLSYYI